MKIYNNANHKSNDNSKFHGKVEKKFLGSGKETTDGNYIKLTFDVEKLFESMGLSEKAFANLLEFSELEGTFAFNNKRYFSVEVGALKHKDKYGKTHFIRENKYEKKK
jgi:hypothetical protein